MEQHRLLNRGVRFYVVQRGDTLSAIGRRLGLPWRRLVQINGLANPHLLYCGQLIQTEE